MRAPGDFAGANSHAEYCSTCANSDGQLKPFAEVLQTNAEYLVQQQGIDPQAARAMAQALLLSMPAWQDPSS